MVAGLFYFLHAYLTKGDKIAKEIRKSKERTEKNAEPIEVPCQIKITRPKSFSGALAIIYLYLNGNYVGELKNGSEIEFETSILNNELTVMEDTHYTGPKPFAFTAIPGGYINYTLLFAYGWGLELKSKKDPKTLSGEGVKASMEYFAMAKADHQFRMRIQKCINFSEHLQLAESEGYSFSEDEFNEAKELGNKLE